MGPQGLGSPIKRLEYVAKQYGERSPDVVLDTFMLLADLAGIERPHLVVDAAAIWRSVGFDLPGLRDRRELLWALGPSALLSEALSVPASWGGVSQRELMDDLLDRVRQVPAMNERFDSDPIWPWVAQQLNKAKKRGRRSGSAREYAKLLDDLRGKGPALAQWQQAESIDLTKTSAAEALEALESFEAVQGVEDAEVVYEFSDGWTIQELTTDAQLRQEGEAMQHCVGGGDYCEQVDSGATTIYSLRDPNGRPHVTMEVPRGTNRFAQVQGKQNRPPIEEYQARVDEFAKAEGIKPASLMDVERVAARRMGEERAELLWESSYQPIVDRDSAPDWDEDETAIVDVVFEGAHPGTDSDAMEAAVDAFTMGLEDRWQLHYEDAMSQLEELEGEVAEEIAAEMQDEDWDDEDAVKVAKGWIWDIPGAGAQDAEYLAGRALSLARSMAGLGAHQTTHFDEDEDHDGQTPGYLPIDATHSGLAQMVLVRDAIDRTLRTRVLELERKVFKSGARKGQAEYRITIDPPIEAEGDPVPWSGMGNDQGSVSLLSWTSKMGTPSFSLPAGAPAIGGSCPGATAGQSVTRDVVRRDVIRGQERTVLEVLGMDPDALTPEQTEMTDLSRAVCQHCYATDNNYAYTSTQLGQLVRMYWARKALIDGTFVEVMIDAIDNADYKMDGASKTLPEPDHWYETGWRFFRIHDSGDFGWAGGKDFGEDSFVYLRAWKEVADAFAPGNPDGFQPIMFWAPTRIWAMRGAQEAVNEIVGSDDKGNFLLRPSGYYLDVPAPEHLGPGWAGASTVYASETAEATLAGHIVPPGFDWDCEAYAVDPGPSCRGAEDPSGRIGCRACWAHRDAVINYRAH